MSITELDIAHRNHLRAYDEALALGDYSAADFYAREMEILDKQIEAASAELDYYDSEDF